MSYKKIRPFSDLDPDTAIDEDQSIPGNFVLATAWQRFWSKMFDLTLLTVLFAAVLGVVAPDFVNSEFFTEDGGSTRLGFLLLLPVVLADAAILSIFGNTLGRAIIGIRVGTKEADNLDLSLSMRRAWRTYFHGMTLGIPLVSYFAYLRNLKKLEKGELTSWDKALETRVFDINTAMWRTCVVATLVIAIRGGMILADQSAIPEASAKPALSASQTDEEQVLREFAKVLENQKPYLRSERHRMDGAQLMGKVGVYYYTLDDRDTDGEAAERIQNKFEKETVPKICSNEHVRILMRDYGVIIKSRYNFMSGRMPLEITISWSDCDTEN